MSSNFENTSLRSLLRILFLTTLTCAAVIVPIEGQTLQGSPGGDSREKIVRALRGADEVKSLRVRMEWLTPGETRVYLVERLNPFRYHGAGQGIEYFVESFVIDGITYKRKNNRPLEREFGHFSSPAKKPDINEEINKISKVRLIGPETQDGIAVLTYEYEQTGPPGLPPVSYKIWIRAKDGLVHRTEHEEQSRSWILSGGKRGTAVKVVTTYYDYNAEIIIELPERAAREAAESWLRLLDAGRYSDSWAQAAGVLKERFSEKAWEKRFGFTGQAGEFCPIKSRELASIESVKSLPSNHGQEGVLLSYATSFADDVSGLEKLELVLDKDRVRRVANYSAVATDRAAERTPGDRKVGGMGTGSGGGVGPGNGYNMGGGDPRLGAGSADPGTVDVTPVPLNEAHPRYTEEALKNKIQGNVTLRLLIGPDGLVKQARILRGLPDGLDEQAIQAAYQLRFKPAMKDGKPVAFWQRVVIEFKR